MITEGVMVRLKPWKEIEAMIGLGFSQKARSAVRRHIRGLGHNKLYKVDGINNGRVRIIYWDGVIEMSLDWVNIDLDLSSLDITKEEEQTAKEVFIKLTQ